VGAAAWNGAGASPLGSRGRDSPMHVVLISEFEFLPSEPVRPGRFAHLSRELTSRGHHVSWLSSSFSHLRLRPRSAEDWRAPPGIDLARIPAATYPGNTHPRRLVSQAQFAWNASVRLRALLRGDSPPDVVVAASPPLLAPWLAGRVAAAAGRPFVVDILDLWPDAFERVLPSGPATGAALFLPRLFRDVVHRSPDVLVGVARDYLSHARHPRTDVFHLGHDMEAFDAAFSSSWSTHAKRPGERWIVYVGTVSDNYDLRPVIEVAGRLPAETFWFVGDGPALPQLRAAAAAARLENVRFTGRVPYAELVNLIARADVGLLGLDARAHIRFPNKAFDYLAAGLEVATSIDDGELRELVTRERLGEFYREGDVASLERALVACLAAAGRPGEKARIGAIARRMFSSRDIYRRYADLLEQLALSPSVASGRRAHPPAEGAVAGAAARPQ